MFAIDTGTHAVVQQWRLPNVANPSLGPYGTAQPLVASNGNVLLAVSGFLLQWNPVANTVAAVPLPPTFHLAATWRETARNKDNLPGYEPGPLRFTILRPAPSPRCEIFLASFSRCRRIPLVRSSLCWTTRTAWCCTTRSSIRSAAFLLASLTRAYCSVWTATNLRMADATEIPRFPENVPTLAYW